MLDGFVYEPQVCECVCVCETDGVSVCERYDAGMNVCKNTGFLRAF